MASLAKLDKLAKKGSESKSKKSEMPEMVIGKELVDSYISKDIAYKDAKLALEEEAIAVKGIFYSDYYKKASEGSFGKSLRGIGSEGSIRLSQKNQFSVYGSEEEIKSIEPEMENFELVRNVAVKKSVFSKPAILKKFLAKFNEAELEEFFDISMKVVAKKGFDKVYAEMSSAKREKYSELVKPYSAGIIVD